MAGRPFWSGQLKISLVSFGVQLIPAVSAQSGVSFHQIDRATGERIRHLNVIGENEPVENSEIVKGYEYTKGKYLTIEPQEISKLRVETKSVIDVKQFVEFDELYPALFDKPYFVLPEPKESPEAFAVVREAMKRTSKAGIGEIAFGGREHLVAIAVPHDASEPGLMAYTLRYEEELRNEREYFAGIQLAPVDKIDKKQLAMAMELIEGYSRPFDIKSFKDDYEDALRELIEAKQKNLPLPVEEDRPGPAKVINLMDALKQSISKAKRPVRSERSPVKASMRKGPKSVGKHKQRVA